MRKAFFIIKFTFSPSHLLTFSLSHFLTFPPSHHIAAFTPNTPSMAVATAAITFRIIDTVFFPLSLIVFSVDCFSRLFLGWGGGGGAWEGWEFWELWENCFRRSRFSRCSHFSRFSHFSQSSPTPLLLTLLPPRRRRGPCRRRSWAAPAPCIRSAGRALGSCPSQSWFRAGRARAPT